MKVHTIERLVPKPYNAWVDSVSEGVWLNILLSRDDVSPVLSSLPNCPNLCNRELCSSSRTALSWALSYCSATSLSLALSSSVVFCSLLLARESLIYLFTRNLLICDLMLSFVFEGNPKLIVFFEKMKNF
jgi:hypothetical protein